VLSDAERERAGRFAFRRDARRFIVARARLRQLLAARSGVPAESVALTYGAHGKPALADPGNDRGLRFNLSHRDELAVFAFSFGREVGIDIEALRELPDADDLAARFFSPREHEAYQALDRGERTVGFFNCWTRKEAFVKALGEGLSHPLDSFDVSLTPGEPAELLRVAPTPPDGRRWRLQGFAPAPGYVAAVAIEVP
jgi:4'-phosphopantetheinyl transferase